MNIFLNSHEAYVKCKHWQTTVFIRLCVFWEMPCIYFISSQYNFSLCSNHHALRNVFWGIRHKMLRTGQLSWIDVTYKGAEMSRPWSILHPICGLMSCGWCKTSHFSFFTANRPVTCWLPNGQSRSVLFCFWETKIQSNIQKKKIMVLMWTLRQTPIEESKICPSVIEQFCDK